LSQTLALFFLFTTPIIYLYLDRLQDWLTGAKKHSHVGGGHVQLAAE
jgi:hypothetical protein